MKIIITNRFYINFKNIHNAIWFNNLIDDSTYKFMFHIIKHGKIHNEKFPAEYVFCTNTLHPYIYYRLFDCKYGEKHHYSINAWKIKVKQLKKENKFRIFK